MKSLYKNSNEGFIALISAVIISLVLMMVVFSVSTLGFFSRFNQLDSEYKEKSSALAESCVDLAILKLIENKDYPGNEVVISADSSCEIKPIQILP